MPVLGSAGISGVSTYNAPNWTPSTVYSAGTLVNRKGRFYIAAVTHTSGAVWQPNKWTLAPALQQIVKPGVFVPAGWGSAYRARRDSASQLLEIVAFGDSTFYGASNNAFGGPSYYSPIQKLKALFLAAGYNDGGHGMFNTGDYGFGYNPDGDGYPTISSQTGFSGTNAGIYHGNTSTAANDQITIQGKGTAVRIVYSRTNVGGRLSYSVDGGAATTVETLIPLGAANAYDNPVVYVGGLTEGIHTVQLKNVGGATIRNPVVTVTAHTGINGTLSIGTTYYYWVTATSANGESLPVTAGSATPTNGNQTITVQGTADYGWTAVNLYRSTTNNSASAGLVATVTPTAGLTFTLNDTGTTAGATPPTVNGLGYGSSLDTVEGWVEFIRPGAPGVCIHRDAVSGQSTPTFFDVANNSAVSNATTPTMLGLQSANTVASINGHMNGLTPGTKPNYRDPSLLIFQIGTNDINGFGSTDPGTLTYQENLAYACRTARSAGIDILLIMPPYVAAVDPYSHKYVGRFKMAMLAVAQAYGAACVDLNEALGYDIVNWFGRQYDNNAIAGNPHLAQAAYDAEAQFLWDEVLSI